MADTSNSLQITIDQLRATNEELQRRKTDAEKDRDLFRDLYSKASTHAAEVTKENNELQERLTVAEGQIRDGLAMVKATYEGRAQALQTELVKWKGVCGILTKRAQLTEDDDLRRRAALEPELREENNRLKEELAKLQQDYAQMEEVLAQLAGHEQADGLPPIAPMLEAPIRGVSKITTGTMQVVN